MRNTTGTSPGSSRLPAGLCRVHEHADGRILRRSRSAALTGGCRLGFFASPRQLATSALGLLVPHELNFQWDRGRKRSCHGLTCPMGYTYRKPFHIYSGNHTAVLPWQASLGRGCIGSTSRVHLLFTCLFQNSTFRCLFVVCSRSPRVCLRSQRVCLRRRLAARGAAEGSRPKRGNQLLLIGLRKAVVMDGRGGRASVGGLPSRSRGRRRELCLVGPPDLVQLLDALILLSSSPHHSLLSAPDD